MPCQRGDDVLKENLFVNEIPNLKHQMTNESQIPIFNDLKILRNPIALYADLGPPLMMPIIESAVGAFVCDFEFGSLEFV
jgi:hypothetical protein